MERFGIHRKPLLRCRQDRFPLSFRSGGERDDARAGLCLLRCRAGRGLQSPKARFHGFSLLLTSRGRQTPTSSGSAEITRSYTAGSGMRVVLYVKLAPCVWASFSLSRHLSSLSPHLKKNAGNCGEVYFHCCKQLLRNLGFIG